VAECDLLARLRGLVVDQSKHHQDAFRKTTGDAAKIVVTPCQFTCFRRQDENCAGGAMWFILI
jgi:hypothetical protein